MADGDAKRSHVRIAAAILAAIARGGRRVHLPVLHRRLHVDRHRHGDVAARRLVMEQDAKVKYRGIQIGKVRIHRVRR